jgi:hypothetical protein
MENLNVGWLFFFFLLTFEEQNFFCNIKERMLCNIKSASLTLQLYDEAILYTNLNETKKLV